jgi:Autographiviridae RNA polymerase
MRHAIELAQRRSDDRVQRLSAYITRRFKEPFGSPEQWVAELLRRRDPDELADEIIETITYCIANEHDWYEACEALARKLKVERGPTPKPGKLRYDRIDRIRAGNLALNFCVAALPDLFALDEEHHAPLVASGAELRLLAARKPRRHFDPPTVRPEPWTRFRVADHSFVEGGRAENRAAIEAAFDDGTIKPHADGVSALQSVPFMFNARVLDVMKWFDKHGIQIDGIPTRTAPTHRNAWYQRKLQGEHRSARVRFERDIDIATRFAGTSFYIRLHCDWRGRISPITDTHAAREDRVRGLLLFANSKPIGERGLFWLKVAVANAGAFDGINRRTFEERVQWCDDHLDTLRTITRFPKDEASHRWLKQAHDPWQFLAACFELADALEAGPSFETRLPILMDASSSGYQHLTLMRRAKDEAALVNLVPDMSPEDFYQTTAAEVEALVYSEYAVSERKVRPISESEIESDQEDDDEYDVAARDGTAADWFIRKMRSGDLRMDRDLVKKNAMTKVYGAEEQHGMTKQNFDKLKKYAEFAELGTCVDISRDGLETRLRYAKHAGRYAYRKINERAGYLAKLIDRVVRKLMPKACDTMDHLERHAEALAKKTEFLRWTTPSGFRLINCYRKIKTKRERFTIRGKSEQKTIAVGWQDELPIAKLEKAVAPNFVHACDSSLLTLAVNAAVREGIVDIVTVHDCLGTHASETERFREIILETLGRMYQEHDVLDEIGIPLERGDYDPAAVLKAKYAFQ